MGIVEGIPPSWAHYASARVYIVFNRQGKKCLTISSGSCHLKIRPIGDGKRKWEVRWIMFDKGPGNEVYGTRIFNPVELATAFDLHRDLVKTDDLFTAHYNAEYGIPGKFIRKGQFLCIPCPGTGVDGDPNMSIFLFPFIKQNITEFIKPA